MENLNTNNNIVENLDELKVDNLLGDVKELKNDTETLNNIIKNQNLLNNDEKEHQSEPNNEINLLDDVVEIKNNEDNLIDNQPKSENLVDLSENVVEIKNNEENLKSEDLLNDEQHQEQPKIEDQINLLENVAIKTVETNELLNDLLHGNQDKNETTENLINIEEDQSNNQLVDLISNNIETDDKANTEQSELLDLNDTIGSNQDHKLNISSEKSTTEIFLDQSREDINLANQSNDINMIIENSCSEPTKIESSTEEHLSELVDNLELSNKVSSDVSIKKEDSKGEFFHEVNNELSKTVNKIDEFITEIDPNNAQKSEPIVNVEETNPTTEVIKSEVVIENDEKKKESSWIDLKDQQQQISQEKEDLFNQSQELLKHADELIKENKDHYQPNIEVVEEINKSAERKQSEPVVNVEVTKNESNELNQQEQPNQQEQQSNQQEQQVNATATKAAPAKTKSKCVIS